ncbi:MAG: LPS assembly protein LptD [Gammaproteobacteria bacterium]|nr:LPS assembly protein LptD [Gammaproteobacteria bacterium]
MLSMQTAAHENICYCLILLFIALASVSAQAQSLTQSQLEQQRLWRYCPTDFVPPSLNYRPLSGKPGSSNIPLYEQPTNILADKAVVTDMEIFELSGNVQMQKGKVVINAEEMEYQRSRDILTARGGLRLQADNALIIGDQARVSLSGSGGELDSSQLGSARIDNAQIWLPLNHLRGEAKQITLTGDQRINLTGAAVTSCMLGNNDWVIKASELQLDKLKNQAVARHARLKVFNVPVLYSPYLSFPIAGRKSGLLAPDLGTSNTSGTEVALPYYWNIAPHRDATLTPRYYSKRGVQLQTELRYLNPSNQGKVYFEYMPEDRLYDQDRGYVYLQHRASPAPGWRADLDYRSASDKDYLNDFGGDLVLSNLDYLERRLNINYQAQSWQANALALDYQTLDKTIAPQSKPYSMLPKVSFDTSLLPLKYFTNTLFAENSPQFQFNSELVNFDRENSLTGVRMDLFPQLQWPLRKVYGFLIPKLAMHYTRYQLQNQFAESEQNPVRTVPMASIDSGLFFERDVHWGSAVMQTLEPRLFYLYVPYRDQSGLLVNESGTAQTFDSAATQLSLSQMFRDNRFSGLDRIGDANQLSVSLSSRFYNRQGKELFSASAGQIYYFSDRRVTLPGQAVQTESRSDLLVELHSQWAKSTYSTFLFLWDEQQSTAGRGSFNFRYKPHQDKMLNLGYRYEKDNIDQADATAIWPLQRQWKLMARWHYSFRDNLTLEDIQGLQYDSCCWALRLVHRRYVAEIEKGKHQESLLLQFELKGLANVGNDINQLFTEGRLE